MLKRTSVFVASASLVASLGCSSSQDVGAPSDPGFHSSDGDGAGSGGGGTSSSGSSGGGSDASTTTSSSGSGGGGGDAGVTTMTGATTWNDGMSISGPVMIAAGATITIAPGATITIAAGATITVAGTLTASAQSTHATLTGAGWGGISVASGGTLSLTGVDLATPTTGIAVAAGATSAEYDYGTITSALTPFNIAKGGAFKTDHAATAKSTGASSVAGSFTATFLSYDSGGSEGIVMSDPTAVFSAEDSKFFGTGNESGDMISVSNASSVHLAYFEITAVHCTFHFDAVDSIDVSYGNLHGASYGFMLYGSSSVGTRDIGFTTMDMNAAWGADEGSTSTANGPITIHDGYWAMNGANGTSNVNRTTTAITVANMSTTTPVAGVGPRGTPGP
jgi:hypothetical protein